MLQCRSGGTIGVEEGGLYVLDAPLLFEGGVGGRVALGGGGGSLGGRGFLGRRGVLLAFGNDLRELGGFRIVRL